MSSTKTSIPIGRQLSLKPILLLTVGARARRARKQPGGVGNPREQGESKIMKAKKRFGRCLFVTGGLCMLLGTMMVLIPGPAHALAGSPLDWLRNHVACGTERVRCTEPFAGCGEEPPPCVEGGGAWYWLRSPEQEKRAVIAHFNRYCIRCHGVDGRGVWDIPDVPNFTNSRWQASRTDGQLARAILEGRGSVMPPWRGTLSLEEAWAMARYVRSLVPGTEVSRPDFTTPEKPAPAPAPAVPPPAPKRAP
jgi:hypothetical protein